MWNEYKPLDVQIYLYDGTVKEKVYTRGYDPNTIISHIEDNVRIEKCLNPEWGLCSIINQSVNVGRYSLKKFANENKVVIIMKIQY